MGGSNPVTSVTQSDTVRRAASFANPTAYVANAAASGLNKARKAGAGTNVGAYLSAAGNEAATPYVGEQPPPPDTPALPSEADIAAQAPDKERLRRQRMAALMAGGRLGTIFGGAVSGTQPNNLIGGGIGKTLVGA